jgi:DNA modification methylase
VTRTETIAEGVTLYLDDCKDVLPVIARADALITDPPYGIGEAAGKNASRSKPMRGHELKMPGKTIIARDYGDAEWDDKPIDADLLDLARAAAKWSIIFGGNYYALPPTSCWLVWDKLNGESDFADCELAWTNLPKAVRRIRFLWNGMLRRERDIAREHPTQKPVDVMKWCIEHLPSDAAHILGRKFIGIEIEPKYFDVACRRISEALKQPDMFVKSAAPEPQRPTFEEIWRDPYYKDEGESLLTTTLQEKS